MKRLNVLSTPLAKTRKLLALLLLPFVLLSAPAWADSKSQAPNADKPPPVYAKKINPNADFTYRKVNLAQLILSSKPKNEKKKHQKFVLKPSGVVFDAVLMSEPKKSEFKYIRMALEMMGMIPAPQIDYQLFVRAEDETVISVYLENQFAENMQKQFRLGLLKIGDSLNFKGYHSYNYRLGPAMVMSGVFDDKKDTLTKEDLPKGNTLVDIKLEAVGGVSADTQVSDN